MQLLFLVWGYMTLVFLLSLKLKRNDIADVAWGIGFLLIAIFSFPQHPQLRQWLMLTFVALWAIRLALHIGFRNQKKGEDPRYKAWREAWGKTFVWRSYLQVYLLQGALMILVASPIWTVMKGDNSPLNWVDGFGIALFIIGLVFESIADLQLRNFKANPQNKGKLMQSGLWRYSRHPNYFGEVLLWWGLGLMALNVSVWGILGSAVISFLILKVSGIPMLEERQKQHPDFAAYAQRTSVFFPLKPKV